MFPASTRNSLTLPPWRIAELSAGLRAILHHPDFQALEAAWRGLDFLVRSVTEEVELLLINICESELATMLSAESSAKSKIYRQLEKIRPAVVLGVYTFGAEDHAVLAGIARLASALHTAFVAGASPGWSAAARSRRSRIRTIGRRNPPTNSRNLMRSDGSTSGSPRPSHAAFPPSSAVREKQ